MPTVYVNGGTVALDPGQQVTALDFPQSPGIALVQITGRQALDPAFAPPCITGSFDRQSADLNIHGNVDTSDFATCDLLGSTDWLDLTFQFSAGYFSNSSVAGNCSPVATPDGFTLVFFSRLVDGVPIPDFSQVRVKDSGGNVLLASSLKAPCYDAEFTDKVDCATGMDDPLNGQIATVSAQKEFKT